MSLRRSALALALGCAAYALGSSPAHAQHADAGVGFRLPKPNRPAAAEEHSAIGGPSMLKKIQNPGVLSEGVRARLEQNAARHAANLPLHDPGHPREGREHAAAGAGGAQHFPLSEPLRRGDSQMRRVQALETNEGVTVLSNRVESPDPRLSMVAPQRPHVVEHHEEPSEAAEPEARENEDLAAAPHVVEKTHNLRALRERPAPPKAASTGNGWLAWPLMLFVATGAVVGTLWFRKKTE